MQKGQTSRRDGIQDFLMPVTDFYGTQGSNMGSHKGTMANDIRGKEKGVKYPYYAPCDCKLIWRDVSNGQGMWQSLERVRFSNGNIDYATFVTAHDNTFDAQIGQVVRQGQQLGNMGDKAGGGAYVTGVHLHIEVAQHKYDISNWKKNKYGIYCFPNETDTDDCFFINNTNMINGLGGNWKMTDAVPVKPTDTRNFVNLPPSIDKWAFYDLNVAPVKKNAKGYLNPKKFGGLSYYVYRYLDDHATAEIQTVQYGRVKIYIKDTCAEITIGHHKYDKGSF